MATNPTPVEPGSLEPANLAPYIGRIAQPSRKPQEQELRDSLSVDPEALSDLELAAQIEHYEKRISERRKTPLGPARRQMYLRRLSELDFEQAYRKQHTKEA
jgi:hypothetical protein